MKRVLAFLAIMLLPLSVMAMSSISDSDLAGVTGQAGVSINVDLNMDLDVNVAAWGDSDGYTVSGTTTAAGWVGVTTLHMNTLRICQRTDLTYSELRLLTIDVGTDSSGVTKVQIGMPTFNITMDSMTANVELGPDNSGVPNLNQTLGTLYLAGLDMALTGYNKTAGTGFVYIYAHNDCGVSIDFANVNIDYLDLDTLSWGDTDGLGSTGYQNCGTHPGYVGLRALNVTSINLNGGITIDVGTNNTSDTSCYYHDIPDHGATFVAIGINDGTTLSIGSISAHVELGATQTLNDGQILGDIYIGGVTATIKDNPSGQPSFVHIFSH